MRILSIFLQVSPDLISPLFMVLFFAIVYFFMIRPQVKKQKEQTKFIDEIAKGDEIVTTSGIYGRINKIEGHIVTLQVDTKTFIRISKSAISKEMTEQEAENNEKKSATA